MVATQWFINARRESADTYDLAARVLDDREDLIHKAAGWMLREAGKRVDRRTSCWPSSTEHATGCRGRCCATRSSGLPAGRANGLPGDALTGFRPGELVEMATSIQQPGVTLTHHDREGPSVMTPEARHCRSCVRRLALHVGRRRRPDRLANSRPTRRCRRPGPPRSSCRSRAVCAGPPSTHSGHASQWMLDMVSPAVATRGTPVARVGRRHGECLALLVQRRRDDRHRPRWRLADPVPAHGPPRRWLSARRWPRAARSASSATPATAPARTCTSSRNSTASFSSPWFNGHAVPLVWGYNQHFETSANCGGGDGKFWVDTFANAPGHSTPGGAQTGTLYKGTNYVFCKVWGPEVRVGSAYQPLVAEDGPRRGPGEPVGVGVLPVPLGQRRGQGQQRRRPPELHLRETPRICRHVAVAAAVRIRGCPRTAVRSGRSAGGDGPPPPARRGRPR